MTSTPASPGWLNAKKVKCLILDTIEKHYTPKIVGVEVPFMSGKRWADLLLVTGNSELIAFEVKSDRDSLRRMANQIRDYSETFNRVYLVLSNKFKDHPLLKKLPKSVGYAFIDRERRSLRYARHAIAGQRLSKANLLFFLWRKDLTKFQESKKESAQDIRARLEKTLSLPQIKTLAVAALTERYGARYGRFLREKSRRVQAEDLAFLTQSSWDTF